MLRPFLLVDHTIYENVQNTRAPIATRSVVSQTVANIKQKSRELNNPPCQIIQSTMTTMPENAYSYMSSRNAMRQVIKKVRKATIATIVGKIK